MPALHSSARSSHATGGTGADGSSSAAGSTRERHRNRSYRRQPELGKRPAAAGRTPSRNNKHGSSWKELLTNLEHDGRVKTLGPARCDVVWGPQLHFACGGQLVPGQRGIVRVSKGSC
jgi:hypothetical protein